MTTPFSAAARATARRAKRAVTDPRRTLDRLRGRVVLTDETPRNGRLSHAEALRVNGFTIYRRLFDRAECAGLAAEFKAAAGIVETQHFTRTDATNKIPVTRQVLFDPRILSAVREALGQREIRFLQPADLHYRHDTVGWHRDSVHRAKDSSDAPDWSDLDGAFGIVKAILYLETDNAAMGIIAGSHASPLEPDLARVKRIENLNGQLIITADDDPNRPLGDAQQQTPLAWAAGVGDVLVFDQRMYHCGRRLDDGVVTKHNDAAKFTLSLVFGVDNPHSERFYSYFRYARREIGYQAYPPDYLAALEQHDLVLRNGLGNYYEQHPDELRLAALRKPETMERLIEEFRAAGSGPRA